MIHTKEYFIPDVLLVPPGHGGMKNRFASSNYTVQSSQTGTFTVRIRASFAGVKHRTTLDKTDSSLDVQDATRNP